jgi:hypothetical protein
VFGGEGADKAVLREETIALNAQFGKGQKLSIYCS